MKSVSTYHKNNKSHSGLSLIELMIVIAIISILSAAASQQYNMYTLKTKCNLSILAGDLNGDYTIDGFEFGRNLEVITLHDEFNKELSTDDVIKRRSLLWFDHSRDNQISSDDNTAFFEAYLMELNGGNLCFQNNFKSNYNSEQQQIDRPSIENYTE